MKKRPPRGMFLNHQDVVSLSSSSAQGLIRHLDTQLVSIKRQVCLPVSASVCLSPVSVSPVTCLSLTCLSLSQIQTVKQTNSVLKEKLSSGIDEFRQPEVTMATQQYIQQHRVIAACSCWLPVDVAGLCVMLQFYLFCLFQMNQKFNTRWTTEEQLLAVQGNT